MAALSRSSASWERVLAAMEAEAARAAALLVADDASASAGIEYDGRDAAPVLSTSPDEPAGVPATWRLPVPASGSSAGTGLTGGAAARAVAGYAAASTATSTAAPSVRQPADAHASTPTTAHGLTAAGAAPADAEPFELPDAADMPPLTAEQLERLTSLQARITELQTELAAAMTEAEAVLARPVARRPDPQPRPELVDRRL